MNFSFNLNSLVGYFVPSKEQREAMKNQKATEPSITGDISEEKVQEFQNSGFSIAEHNDMPKYTPEQVSFMFVDPNHKSSYVDLFKKEENMNVPTPSCENGKCGCGSFAAPVLPAEIANLVIGEAPNLTFTLTQTPVVLDPNYLQGDTIESCGGNFWLNESGGYNQQDEDDIKRDKIERIAYFKWCDAGKPDGMADEFWTQAENEFYNS